MTGGLDLFLSAKRLVLFQVYHQRECEVCSGKPSELEIYVLNSSTVKSSFTSPALTIAIMISLLAVFFAQISRSKAGIL